MLLRALQEPGLDLLIAAVGARQRAQIGEHTQQPVLARDQRGVASEQVGALSVQVGDRPLHLGGTDVVAEHQPLHPAQVLCAGVERAVAGGGQGSERQALARRLRRSRLDRLERHQRRPGADVDVLADQYLLHPAPERRGERRLHLHRLDHRDHIPGLDDVTGGHGNRDQQGRAGCADNAAVIARETVRHAVEVHDEVLAAIRGHGPVGPAEELEPALVRPEPPSDQLDRVPVDPDPVAVGGDLRDGEPVGLPAVAQLVGARQCAARSRTASASESVEAGAVIRRVPVGQLDRGLEQRQIGVAHRNGPPTQVQPLEPAGVEITGAYLGTAEQLEQKALVRGPALDHRDGVGERPAQPRQRLAAVAAPGGQRDDRRVELGRDRIAFDHPGVDPQAGPGRQSEVDEVPGRRREGKRRVLGAQACLDGVPDRCRRVALEPPARGDVQLELDQVEAGDRLAYRMAELRRHFRGIEATRFGLVEKLDRPCAAVSGVPRQPLGRVHDVSLLIGGEGRTRGFGEDRFPPPLTRAIAYTERPHRAVAVGNDRNRQSAHPSEAVRRRRHRDSAVLGGDRVHPSHHRRIGSHEHEPEPLAQVRELGPVGHQPTTGPCGIGARVRAAHAPGRRGPDRGTRPRRHRERTARRARPRRAGRSGRPEWLDARSARARRG